MVQQLLEMPKPCNEFNQLLSNIPVYSSWKAHELQTVFTRFRGIVVEIVQSEDYKSFRWLADYCPDLDGRIQQMLAETEMVRQCRQFNNIVFELQCAIEVIAGTFECDNQEEFNSFVFARTS